jgi:Amt family ammonium transporter
VHDCNLVRPDGKQLPVQVTAAPILGRDGALVGAIMVVVDVSQARALAEELSYRANHDPLTGLHNRFALEQALRDVAKGASERGEHHALLYMDLDQFKVVNDSCGHAAGDALLKQLGVLIRSKMRAGDTLARMGGDEFAVILRHCPVSNAVLVAEEIRNVMAEFRFTWDEKSFAVGVSVGVAAIDETAGDIQTIMSNADTACYEAKEAGRNRVYVYEPGDQALAKRRGDMALVSRIRRAMDEQRFVLFGQHILHAYGRPVGCEVLLRMLDEDNQRVSPDAFLPAAERYGLIEQLDRWVVEQVVRMLESASEPLPGLDFYAINVSAASLGSPDFTAYVRQLLDAKPELGRLLCFEITETSAIRSLHKARDFMNALAGHGVRFALDDFGTGMSSLSYLKHLPVDMVKIDGSFVRDIAHDPVDHGMVRAINDIAHLMNKHTIAEFVEDAEVLARLQALGVDYVQGYHLGHPVPLAELARPVSSSH